MTTLNQSLNAMVPLTKIGTMEEIQNGVEKLMGGNPKNIQLVFSMFGDTDKDDDKYLGPDFENTDPLPAFQGKTILWSDYWRITHEKTPEVFSPLGTMENANLETLLSHTNALISKGDGCGVFLEGFRDTERVTSEGARIIEVVIGS